MSPFRLPSRNNPFVNAARRTEGETSDEAYPPPAGPPPSHRQTEYLPPPGPTPSYQKASSGLTRESAVHPSSPSKPSSSDQGTAPPPYHDWESAVPDTALLPPPPSLGYENSPTSNADGTDAQRAWEWCERNPLMLPHQPTKAQIDAVQCCRIGLQKPRGHNSSVRELSTGRWNIKTTTDSSDACFVSTLPLFFEKVDSPLHTERAKTFYYETKVLSLLPQRDKSISAAAVGFCAVPYPVFRMPGWERGSLAVHSDDGHRYVNDNEGGKDFTSPIKPGETVGLGISYTLANALQGEVFFTRNGEKAGSWDVNEEFDSNQMGPYGVNGKYDVFAAIGIYGKVSLDVSFNRRDWLWKP